MFLVKSSENIPPCPCCNGSLKYRDSKKRIRKHEGGDKDYILIRRFRCTECNRYHNELPDILLPYKHYEAEVISGVIDEMVQPTDLDSEDYPCISTMMYWLLWFQKNLSNIEGYLKSIGYRFLNLGNDFLFSDHSLLNEVRKTHPDWLEKVTRIIYNTGGFLPAFYY